MVKHFFALSACRGDARQLVNLFLSNSLPLESYSPLSSSPSHSLEKLLIPEAQVRVIASTPKHPAWCYLTLPAPCFVTAVPPLSWFASRPEAPQECHCCPTATGRPSFVHSLGIQLPASPPGDNASDMEKSVWGHDSLLAKPFLLFS